MNAECHAQIENFIDRIKHIKSIKLTYNKKKKRKAKNIFIMYGKGEQSSAEQERE